MTFPQDQTSSPPRLFPGCPPSFFPATPVFILRNSFKIDFISVAPLENTRTCGHWVAFSSSSSRANHPSMRYYDPGKKTNMYKTRIHPSRNGKYGNSHLQETDEETAAAILCCHLLFPKETWSKVSHDGKELVTR